MLKIYQLLIAAVISMGFVTANAEVAVGKMNISGNVGIVSDYISSGSTMSGGNPSFQANIQAEMYGLYGLFSLNTLQSQFFKRFQAEWIPTVGYQTQIGDLQLYTQLAFYRYTGGILPDGSNAKDNDYNEWDTGFSWGDFFGQFCYNATKPKGGAHDSQLQLGINHDFGPAYLELSVAAQHYKKKGKNRIKAGLIKVGHEFNNGIEPFAALSIGGKNVDNERIATRFFVGLIYNF